MRVEPGSWRRMGEQRRYFPDWTASLLARCPEIEADHNSYLACGYAEEFGYRAQPESSRGVPVLDGESPEECIEWRGQAQGTHPGYPIRPHPLDIEVERGSRWNLTQDIEQPRPTQEEAGRHGAFVWVSDRPYRCTRTDATRRSAALTSRFAAAVIELRWRLPRSR